MATGTAAGNNKRQQRDDTVEDDLHYLTVGVLCLDETFDLEEYPAEDTKCRAGQRTLSKGGSAANVAFQLRKLVKPNCKVGICSAIVKDKDGDYLVRECENANVDSTCVIRRSGGATPKSVVLRVNSSRTIIHHRDVDEVFFQEFSECFKAYNQTCAPMWVHFEGRNTAETLEMMSLVKSTSNCRFSLELERARTMDEFKLLETLPNIVVFSNNFVKQFQSDGDIEKFFEWLLAGSNVLPDKDNNALWVVTMGDRGSMAAVVNSNGIEKYFTCPAEDLGSKVVDSLGAGDVFLAGLIFALGSRSFKYSGHQESKKSAVQYATSLVAEKLQRYGL